MTKSKTLIDNQAKRKTNPELVETILACKKNEKWVKIAGILSSPRRNKIIVNLDALDSNSKEGDTIVVPGKVLGKGDVSKKIRVASLSFSEEARKKLKDKKCEIVTIKEEVKINPKAQGVKVI
jgi:large subunit ribosomal protein L18e